MRDFILTKPAFNLVFYLTDAFAEVSSKCPSTLSPQSEGLGRIASPQFVPVSVCSLLA